ncbi:hypothetical protein ACFE04_011226 [Oxalis oulophora]
MEQTLKLKKLDEGSINRRRFSKLRSVQWRIDLSILPSHSSSESEFSSIDDLRRATADSRRRLRRQLLSDYIPKDDGSNNPDRVMDNPLSQNPDSTWGRFFRNAELEKMVDQDLSRLYPEHGSYFQTHGCQGMLRRILLLWCLRHPELGYRQGMHELLAPLLYVLHVDLERLAEVRELYEDHFTDKFDGLSYQENDLTYSFDIKRFVDSMDDDEDMDSSKSATKLRSLDELDPEIQTIIQLTDVYGAEGELGIVLSNKFFEHDAYCMFDALMSGTHGSVAMSDFFAHTQTGGLHTGLSPVIEASAELYYLLSVVDSSLHSHLVELGVEPQYFALRWLRVLFGREFSLNDLLIVWDEIFSAENCKFHKGVENEDGSSFGVLNSRRGALISGIAVSMMLYIRSSLLATENATSCLKRLLNFPENVNLRKIIEKAKSLQTLALDINISSSYHPFHVAHGRSKSVDLKGHTNSSGPVSPKTPRSAVPDTYWEEKWRVLNKEEQLKENSSGKSENRSSKKSWAEKVRSKLSRTESDPSPAKARHTVEKSKPSVRRSLLEDLSRQLGLDEDVKNLGSHEIFGQEKSATEARVEIENGAGASRDLTCTSEDRCLNANTGSEENSSIFSDPPSPINEADDRENSSDKSSVGSNLSIVDESDDRCKNVLSELPLPLSTHGDDVSEISDSDSRNAQCTNDDSDGNSVIGAKERKHLSGKFHWLWKFSRNAPGQESIIEGTKSAKDEISRCSSSGSSIVDMSNSNAKGDEVDQNQRGSLKSLGQSMVEHIQVIECIFQQDRGQMSSLDLVAKGHITAMTALSELRKISNLLSEM